MNGNRLRLAVGLAVCLSGVVLVSVGIDSEGDLLVGAGMAALVLGFLHAFGDEG